MLQSLKLGGLSSWVRRLAGWCRYFLLHLSLSSPWFLKHRGRSCIFFNDPFSDLATPNLCICVFVYLCICKCLLQHDAAVSDAGCAAWLVDADSSSCSIGPWVHLNFSNTEGAYAYFFNDPFPKIDLNLKRNSETMVLEKLLCRGNNSQRAFLLRFSDSKRSTGSKCDTPNSIQHYQEKISLFLLVPLFNMFLMTNSGLRN